MKGVPRLPRNITENSKHYKPFTYYIYNIQIYLHKHLKEQQTTVTRETNTKWAKRKWMYICT